MKTIQQVLQMDIEHKNVLIIGCPASGKTYLSNKFQTSHKKFHTDDYMKFGYEQSMYKVLEDIKKSNEYTLVEGIQGYRLLRKGVQLDCYHPEIVIELIISDHKMLDIYRNERDEKKIKYLKGFNKMHEKIINDYFILSKKREPEWIKVYNEH